MFSVIRMGCVAVAALVCAGLAAGCASTVAGAARVPQARDATAPAVAPADLEKLLLSDAQVSDLVGTPGLVSYHPYSDIPPPAGEVYTPQWCAEAVFNTEWTAYNGSGYTGAAGHKVGEPGDRPAHEVDQGVVTFPSADAAARFVVRAELDWDRCADVHFSDSVTQPRPSIDWYTIGFANTSGAVATLIATSEGGEGYVCARGLTSRANVVIDVYACGKGYTAAQPVALVNAIANKMPH